MGKLVYGTGTQAMFDDRTLAHMQLVISAKLRRGESFFVSFTVEDKAVSLWMQQAIPLQIVFDSTDPIHINRQWLEDLSNSANSAHGLQLSPEPVRVAQ